MTGRRPLPPRGWAYSLYVAAAAGLIVALFTLRAGLSYRDETGENFALVYPVLLFVASLLVAAYATAVLVLRARRDPSPKPSRRSRT